MTIGPFFALVIGWMVFRWSTGDEEAREQVATALVAAAVFLAGTVPVLIVADRASERS